MYDASQVRNSLQKKRLIHNKDLNSNFAPLSHLTQTGVKLEEIGLNRINHRRPNKPFESKRFEFLENLTSPSRVRSYKIDPVNILVSRLKRFILKHFTIWKEHMEALRNEENNIFIKGLASKSEYREAWI